MQSTLLVMAGGALGAAARYHGGLAVTALVGERWPWATFAVNSAGALLIGLLAGWALTRGLAEPWRLFLAVGVLGGFTTFSAFSFEAWRMIEQGSLWPALGYAALSVVVTVVFVWMGVVIMRGVAG